MVVGALPRLQPVESCTGNLVFSERQACQCVLAERDHQFSKRLAETGSHVI